MKCKLCSLNPDIEKINEALTSGQSIQSLALEFNINKTTLTRHKNHLLNIPLKTLNSKDIVIASLPAQIKELKERTMLILNQAEQDKDSKLALLAIKEVRLCFELINKLEGELISEDSNLIQINIIMP
jgi:transposase-like protein